MGSKYSLDWNRKYLEPHAPPKKIKHSYHPQRPLSKVQQAPNLLPLMDEVGIEGHQHRDVQEVMHAKEDPEDETQP